MRLDRDSVLAHLCTAALPTKKPEWKHSLTPLSPVAQEEQEVSHWRDYGNQHSMLGEQGAMQSGKFRPESPARVATWGLGGQELNAWDSLPLDRSPHRQACPTPTCGIAHSANQWGRAQKPPALYISTGEIRRSSGRDLSELLSQYKLHWLLRPWLTETSRAETLETSTTSGVQDPSKPLLLELPSVPKNELSPFFKIN